MNFPIEYFQFFLLEESNISHNKSLLLEEIGKAPLKAPTETLEDAGNIGVENQYGGKLKSVFREMLICPAPFHGGFISDLL